MPADNGRVSELGNQLRDLGAQLGALNEKLHKLDKHLEGEPFRVHRAIAEAISEHATGCEKLRTRSMIILFLLSTGVGGGVGAGYGAVRAFLSLLGSG